MLELDEDTRIVVTVIYGVGAVVSIWAAIFSGDIFAWMGIKERKQRYKTGKEYSLVIYLHGWVLKRGNRDIKQVRNILW